jgi:hypothetical protein
MIARPDFGSSMTLDQQERLTCESVFYIGHFQLAIENKESMKTMR